MERINKVVSVLKGKGLDAVFLMKDANIRYVSGFTGSDSYIILAPQGRVFITDSRYTEQAEEECPDFEVICHRNPSPSLEEIIREVIQRFNIKKLGFEQDFVTFENYEKIRNVVFGMEFVPSLGIVESVRYTKDEGEINLIKKACQIADEAFSHILGMIKPGVTEMEIELELDYIMRKKGANGVSFPTIVASGPRSSLPHAVPSERKIQKGDFITLDFGALYQGYHSDMTRTMVIGEPDAKQKEIYETVRKAQEAGLNAVKAGVKGSLPDRCAREVIEKAGYGPNFGHGLGHGVGLEIHEEPSINPKCEKMLAAGSVVTVEPGIYLPHWGGVRIEDSVVVKEDGCEILTHSPKEMIVL